MAEIDIPPPGATRKISKQEKEQLQTNLQRTKMNAPRVKGKVLKPKHLTEEQRKDEEQRKASTTTTDSYGYSLDIDTEMALPSPLSTNTTVKFNVRFMHKKSVDGQFQFHNDSKNCVFCLSFSSYGKHGTVAMGSWNGEHDQAYPDTIWHLDDVFWAGFGEYSIEISRDESDNSLYKVAVYCLSGDTGSRFLFYKTPGGEWMPPTTVAYLVANPIDNRPMFGKSVRMELHDNGNYV